MNQEFDVVGRIKDLCEKKRISYYKISKDGEIPYSTITNMLNRGSVPSVYTLEKMCSVLDITLSEFFMDNPQDYTTLTESQREFLNVYNHLTESEKALTMSYMQGLAHIQK